MNDHDNLEEFRHPERYDAENGTFEPEGPFYFDLVKRHGGPVLDVACGTGRLAIPFAAAGFDVTAIDLSRPALDYARQKASTLPICFIEADCRSFDLDERFALAVMSGHGFQFMLTDDDQRRLLASVHRHLWPGGIFAFETRKPSPECLDEITKPQFWRAFSGPDGRMVETWVTQRSYRPSGIVHYCLFHRQVDGGETASRVSLRFSDIEHIELLLAGAGFDIVALYGDWSGEAPDDDCSDLVFVCRRS